MDTHRRGPLPMCLWVVVVGRLQPEEGNHQTVGDKRQAAEGKAQFGGGRPLAEVGNQLVVKGKTQAVVGKCLPGGGILGSSLCFSASALFL